ncbi:uncharacterized protein CELE_R05D7.7 [Caenorhabditis elegans]|uniref:Uncharacterized protein n=1 Tax=Caenorhabditis elegans TaxID=6239 RepID=B0M0N7_CAEEL|nr:Uncharacterized protein CELE_R05D7.7 [Caenorhabditis elegans]CAP72375.1 Uncharacterized protein CELE_R05D7.7 [Caenorhabditis elegans]|eukprot:NP_001122500.1 Uncharacterized protein CELE_R05D7.7 [Caenorhabditis elegans]
MPTLAPRAKWKFRIFYTLIFFYLLYRVLKFLNVLLLNNSLGSPLDFSDLMVEKDAKTVLEEFIKFKSNDIPFDFHKIAMENEQLLQAQRKNFIRSSSSFDGFIKK